MVGEDVDVAALDVACEVSERVGSNLRRRAPVLHHRNSLLRELRVLTLQLEVLLHHRVEHRHERESTLRLEPCVDAHHAVMLFLDEAMAALALRLGPFLGTLGVEVALPPQRGLHE